MLPFMGIAGILGGLTGISKEEESLNKIDKKLADLENQKKELLELREKVVIREKFTKTLVKSTPALKQLQDDDINKMIEGIEEQIDEALRDSEEIKKLCEEVKEICANMTEEEEEELKRKVKNSLKQKC